jgi:hypothetical protein
LTVTCDTLKHVLPIRYEILTVPPFIPDTKPVRELTVAVEALEVLQVPPVLALVSIVDCPVQTVKVPVLAGSVPLTVTTLVAAQPTEFV